MKRTSLKVESKKWEPRKKFDFNVFVEPLVTLIRAQKTNVTEYQTVMTKLCTWFPPMFEPHNDMKNLEVWTIPRICSILDLVSKGKSSFAIAKQEAHFLRLLPKFVQQLHFPHLKWNEILVRAIDGLDKNWIRDIFDWANSGLLEKDSVILAQILQVRIEQLLKIQKEDQKEDPKENQKENQKILLELQSTWTKEKMAMDDDESDDDGDTRLEAWQQKMSKKNRKKLYSLDNFAFSLGPQTSCQSWDRGFNF